MDFYLYQYTASGVCNNCDNNAVCTQIDGNFTCTCNQGYTGDGVNCTGT